MERIRRNTLAPRVMHQQIEYDYFFSY